MNKINALPDGAGIAPVASLKGARRMKMLVLVKQVPGHRHAGQGRERPPNDRPDRHHLDRLPVRRVRARGGPPDQGEAESGGRRGRGGDPRSGAGQGSAPLVPGDGRRPGHPRERSGVRGRGHADRGPGAGGGGEAGEPAARAVRAPGDRRRHGRHGRAGGGDPRLAVPVVDHGGGRRGGREAASAWAARWKAASRSSTCRCRAW